MTFDEVQFPTRIALGSRGGPSYSNTVIETKLGYEKRVVRWDQALHSYNVAPGLKNNNDVVTLIKFFIARKGASHGFRFKDWMDYSSAANHRDAPGPNDQPTIELTTTTFQLIKRYTSGGESTDRAISKPVTGTVRVAVGGVELGSGWAVDTTTGIVTFDIAPADVVTAGFQFDVPVRFSEDLDKAFTTYPAGYNKNKTPDVTLQEIRVNALPSTETGAGDNNTPLDPGFRQARRCAPTLCTAALVDPTKPLYMKFTGVMPPSLPATLPGGDVITGLDGEVNNVVVCLRSNGSGWDQSLFTYADEVSDFIDLTVTRVGGDLVSHEDYVRILANYSPSDNGIEIIVYAPLGGTASLLFRMSASHVNTCTTYANLGLAFGDDVDGPMVMFGGTVTFYQGDSVAAAGSSEGDTTDDLINLMVPKDEVPSLPYFFQWSVDAKCYEVRESDPAVTPGIVAYSGTRTEMTGCDDENCTCASCANNFAFNTGVVFEHNDTLGGGTSDFVRHSDAFTICMKDKSTIRFNAVSDDFVILTASTDDVTQSYSGTPGDPVTINLPENYLIFRDTIGSTRSAGSGGHPATVQKTFTDGTKTFVLADGVTGGSGGHVVDMEDDGFETLNWSDDIPVAVFREKGWLNAVDVGSFKFHHVVSGGGSVSVTQVLCDGVAGSGGSTEVADVEIYDGGETTDAPNARDGKWFIESALLNPAYFTAGPYGALPLQGTRWIAADAAGTPGGAVSLYTNIVLGPSVNASTFKVPIKISAGNSIVEVYVNGVAQTIAVPYPVAMQYFTPSKDNSAHFYLDSDFVTGDNLIEVRFAQAASLDVQSLCIKFGIPTF